MAVRSSVLTGKEIAGQEGKQIEEKALIFLLSELMPFIAVKFTKKLSF